MPDILFAYPRYSDDTFYQLQFDRHLGAAYLITYLQSKGIDAQAYLSSGPSSVSRVADDILARDPRVVGFTCYDVTYYFIKLIARQLKKKNKNITVMLGGPSATFSDALILRDEPAIDICVRGEGENATLALTACLKKRGSLRDIGGVSFRESGRVRRNPRPPIIADRENQGSLDAYPSPYLEKTLPADKNIGILSSRGCIYRCIYCNFSALSEGVVRYHSVDRVIAEASVISRAAPGSQVYIYDDNFMLNKERVRAICRGLIRENVFLRLCCTGRIEALDDGLLRLMKKAGIGTIAVGLESAVPRNLRTIRKFSTGGLCGHPLAREKRFVSYIRTLSQKMHSLGMQLDLSIITGLPKETAQEAKKTVAFVDSLKLDACYHDFMTIYPGTPLFASRRDFGLDVIKPRTVLPFKTRFSFDVKKIPLSKYAFPNFAISASLMQLTTEALTGCASRRHDGRIIDTVVAGKNAGFLRWLNAHKEAKERLSLSFVLINMGDPISRARKQLYDAISRKLPLINMLTLKRIARPAERGARTCELNFMTEVIERRRWSSCTAGEYHFINFSRLKKGSDNSLKMPQSGFPRSTVFMLVLDSHEDKAVFKWLLEDNAPLKEALENAKGSVEMACACQWGGQACPALDSGTVYVSKGKTPCRCAKAVVMPQAPAISAPVQKDALAQVEKRRGCSRCPAKNSCSRCLYTYPFTEDEFCSLRRKFDTGRLLRMLSAHNHLQDVVKIRRIFNS